MAHNFWLALGKKQHPSLSRLTPWEHTPGWRLFLALFCKDVTRASKPSGLGTGTFEHQNTFEMDAFCGILLV
jgi:hypothetical protein